MKRLIIGTAASISILSGFASCGKAPVLCDGDSLMDKAQICPDRASLGFAQEFGTGTYIGTKPVETLSIRNGGIADLHVSSISISGDPEFTMQARSDSYDGGSEVIRGDKHLLVQVAFAPKLAKAYSATITINSDAENKPMATFGVSGCGIPSDGGTSPCYRDGGM